MKGLTLTSAFVLFFSIIIWFVFLRARPPTFFLMQFSHVTNDIFEEINNIELPTKYTAMIEHTVTCRIMANKIQRNPIFKSHGAQMEKRLREFGERIRESGHLIQKMYSKGSTVYKSFDIEIKAMIYRLNPNNIRKGDARYFKERLNVLIKKIKEFRILVRQTYNSIQRAENDGNDTVNYISDELKKVITFNIDDDEDIVGIKKELGGINNILNHLRENYSNLDKMEKILKDYENKLTDIYDELDDRYDGIVEFTKEGLESLKFIDNNLKDRFVDVVHV